DLVEQLFRAGIARQRVEPGNIREERRSGQQVAADAGGPANASYHALDLEAAVVKELAHAPFGGRKVVRVVDVPEEAALLQVVGHHDEQHASGLEHPACFGDELNGGVDARHVFEHLVRIDDPA